MKLDAFAGDWTVERAIEDVRAGRAGRFEGRARFTADAEGLAYREEGVLTMDGTGGFAASRRYHWRDGGSGTLEVRFDDGRLFHRFYADEPMPGAAHECPPDRYRVGYDFRAWPRWMADWRVRGPRKDYRIMSTFTRPGAGP